LSIFLGVLELSEQEGLQENVEVTIKLSKEISPVEVPLNRKFETVNRDIRKLFRDHLGKVENRMGHPDIWLLCVLYGVSPVVIQLCVLVNEVESVTDAQSSVFEGVVES
jgi:hypothetical protein